MARLLIRHKVFLLLLLLVVAGARLCAQSISGFVYDETNAPIPFANIYIKDASIGTAADAQGRYYMQLSDPGVTSLVITAVGYETQESSVTVEHQEDLVKNIWLNIDRQELEEVSISARRRDPAYDIIASAIDAKPRWNNQFERSKCDVYIKASEVITEKEKKRRDRKRKQEELEEKRKANEEETEFDLNELDKQKREAAIKKLANERNMAEVQMTRYFQQPNQIKEIREGFKKYGDIVGLFYITTNQADFNFYENLMDMGNLNELPVISPLHPTSIITYKFKLEETLLQDGEFLYRIRVTPRKRGNASWEGEIWIANKTYHIQKVDLELSEEGLKVYRDFRVQQEFVMTEDSFALLKRQEFDYTSKGGGSVFRGNTIARYENYTINPEFDKRFFRNEVAVTTQDAYEKDSTYWDKIRPEPLTREEQRYQFVKDSIYAVTTSEVYLDSLDSVYNRVTFMDVIWEGIGFSNRIKKQYLYFPAVPTLVNPFMIGGVRIGPNVGYFKKWDNEQTLFVGGRLDMGVRNQDLKGIISLDYRFDPMHLGTVGVFAGKTFNLIAQNDAVTFLFQRSSWIEENRFSPYITRELVNGLQASLAVEYVERLPINGYEFGEITEDWFGGNEPLSFARYQTFITTLSLSYTPFQKYMTEPYRKVVLGSKWPTFSVKYKRGIPDILGSDINFDYAELAITQRFKVRTLGTSSYRVKSGQFFNKQDLRFVDYKIFPRGDLYFFSSFMNSMQIQDTTLFANDLFVQAHYVHHFNGSFMNLIPLVNRLGIHTVVGASGLWIRDSRYQYGEWFGGVERYFKSSRARWRLGVYYVDAVSNFGPIKPRVKFAINRYSLRDESWTN